DFFSGLSVEKFPILVYIFPLTSIWTSLRPNFNLTSQNGSSCTIKIKNQFGFMSKARCNALELKKEPRLMQDMPSDKPKSALHLTRLR
ncbi:MAG: hypothetical protein ACLFTI_07500, partial [Anaerolineales bacterium]